VKSVPYRALCLIALAACEQDAEPDAADAGLPTRVVSDAAELAALPARVRGNLTLRGEGLVGALSAPRLSQVDGTLSIEAEGLTELALPALRQVDGECAVSGARALTALFIPVLARCDAVRVTGNPELGVFDAPALAESRWLALTDNRTLTTLALPLLDFAPLQRPDLIPYGNEHFISLIDNPALGELALPALRSLTSLTVSRNTQLRSITLPLAAGPAMMSIMANGLLESVRLPRLSGLVEIANLDADSLRDLDVGALREVNYLRLTAPSLRTLDLPSLESTAMFGADAPTLVRFSAPKLRSAETLRVMSERLREVALPLLDTGCEALELGPDYVGNTLASCLVPDVLPSCPPGSVAVRDDCTCGAAGDPSAVICPKASE
jgi:hypothetical protein